MAKGGAVAVLLGACLLGGCSNLKTYRSSEDRNIRFTTVADSGSLFSSIRTSVHVYSVAADCRTTYEGTIDLNRKTIDSGIPAGRRSYLKFIFASSSFFGNSRSATRYGTLLTPRRGRNYAITVRYVDDTYNAVVREVTPGRRARREVEHLPLSRCKPA